MAAYAEEATFGVLVCIGRNFSFLDMPFRIKDAAGISLAMFGRGRWGTEAYMLRCAN